MTKLTKTFLSIFLVFIILTLNGYYLNYLSDSLPRGIYKKINKQPEVGDYVASCLTNEIADYGLKRGYLTTGNCDTGMMPLMKRIVAKSGQKVEILNNQLLIDDQIMKDHPLFSYDSHGRELKLFYDDKITIPTNKYFIMSAYKQNSWDSRYFGAVEISFVLKPIIQFKKEG